MPTIAGHTSPGYQLRGLQASLRFMTRLRQAVFVLHLTTGSVAGVVIFFLAGTGSILAWQRQVIAWQERGYRAAPPSAGIPALPLDRLVAIATSSAEAPPSSVTVRSDPAAPVDFELGRNRQLFLDRYSGAVLGPGATRTRTFFDDVTSLHRWFGAPVEHHTAARAVKGAFDLSLLFMIVTGAFLWAPCVWNWRRLRSGMIPLFRLKGRARDWNRHNLIGFWIALPLTVIVLTGAVLAYGWATNLLYLATGTPLNKAPKAAERTQHRPHRHDGQPEAATAVDLQQILDSAEQKEPGWRSIRVPLQDPHAPTMAVFIDFLDGGRPDRQTQMVFDRTTGMIVRIDAFSSLSLGRQLRSFMKYIHTGEAGGVAGETVAGLTSLSSCVLVWTGLSMAIRRFRAARVAPRKDGVLVAKEGPVEVARPTGVHST